MMIICCFAASTSGMKNNNNQNKKHIVVVVVDVVYVRSVISSIGDWVNRTDYRTDRLSCVVLHEP